MVYTYFHKVRVKISKFVWELILQMLVCSRPAQSYLNKSVGWPVVNFVRFFILITKACANFPKLQGQNFLISQASTYEMCDCTRTPLHILKASGAYAF